MNEPFRLFVVDANEEVAILMRFHLERAGHEVTVCRTAADAQIVLGQSPYHLVLLDDHLPDMHGLKLLQTLAAEGFHAPVLIMTAHGDEKVATQALLAGAIDFLVKDNALAFLAELPQRVEEAVTRHRLQQSNQRQLLHAQKMQSVGTLAGGVAHEFNNLLAGIQGYAALALREPGTSAELTQFLQFIVELSDRAANLTRQLLAFARKPVLTRHPTNLASLLSATADLVRSSMRIDVNVEVPDAAPHPHPPGDGGGERGGTRARANRCGLWPTPINFSKSSLTSPATPATPKPGRNRSCSSCNKFS